MELHTNLIPGIDSALCKGCDACVKICLHHAIPYQAIYWFKPEKTGRTVHPETTGSDPG